MMKGMATRKVTLSLEASALEFAERAAKAHGVSVSSWLSRAARREAVRTGYHASGSSGPAAESAARGDETEIAAAVEDLRAQG
jgi:hypothetical protein